MGHFTFRLSSNKIKVKKIMNRRVISKEVNSDGRQRFRRMKMQGRMRPWDLQNMLNGSSVGEIRLIQHQINGAKSIHAGNMLDLSIFSESQNVLKGEVIGRWR